MEDKKMLNDEELEKVNGGATPELPAQQLNDIVYPEMFKAGCELNSSEPQPHDCSGLIP
ncbi:MAG: hypothetical protein MJ147_01400 [Clostridia bacterium]|nr:hypothetical protein [Clostridia bacterium]